MRSKEIRQSYLDFFKSKGHTIVRSSPCIPASDPTLLFTNSGMNQFKDVFLGTGTRNYTRVTDTQKCIRASGKHNDLEDVGRDTYHHTFFEMLGNWSFGDYYKAEAIEWAWDLFTKVWKLPADRLYVTVYQDDDEAAQLWEKITKIHSSRVLRFGKKENFWEMGETGPCGPCSEIHIDLTENGDGGKLVNMDSPEVIELWNLVFIQYNRNEKGGLDPLPKKHVDTGMGFERISSVIQKKKSNYDSDIFEPLFAHIEELSKQRYTCNLTKETDIAFRVIADHVRTLSFAIADGAFPSNEGRGYVLRRILRRATKYVHTLGVDDAMLYKLAPTLAEQMKDIFPELTEHLPTITKIIRSEEENFLQTLSRGLELFSQVAEKTIKNNTNIISGEEAFKLYDTYGFPLDLTKMIAKDKNLSVSDTEFESCMEEQKKRARADRKEKHKSVTAFDSSEWIQWNTGDDSAFLGYTETSCKSELRGLKANSDNLILLFDQTTFYAESGGQIGDTGQFETDTHQFTIYDTQKDGNKILHFVNRIVDKKTSEEISINSLQKGTSLSKIISPYGVATIDKDRRSKITSHHTATHLLHAALRTVLGKQVQQKGSLVSAERLRFDFSHSQKISDTEMTEIEQMINLEIRKTTAVKKHVDIPFEEAKSMGALAFFGDKYGDVVRVIEVPNFSIEFCGGTHTGSVGEIGLLKVVSESSISSGIRRIEAVVAKSAEELFQHQFIVLQTIKGKFGIQNETDIEHRMVEFMESSKKLEKELSEMKFELFKKELDKLTSKEIHSVSFVSGIIKCHDAGLLRNGAEYLRNKLPKSLIFLGADVDGKVALSLAIGNDLQGKYHAGKIISDIAKHVQGNGGGKPELATAGGKDVSKLHETISLLEEIIKK